MKKLLFALLFFPNALSLFAQKQEIVKKDTDAIKYSQTITISDLKEHLSILASDEYKGRGNGQDGLEMAAKYLASYFQKLGLPPIGNDNSYYQYIDLEQQAWENPKIVVDDINFNFIKDFYCLSRYTTPLDTTISEIVFAGYGIEDRAYNDYKKIDVKDKVVMILEGLPTKKRGKAVFTDEDKASKWSRDFAKIAKASEKGAKAVLIVTDSLDKRVSKFKHAINANTMTLNGLKKKDKGKQPNYANTAFISKKVANTIIQKGSRKLTINRLINKINKRGKAKSKTIKTSTTLSLNKKVKKIIGKNVLGFIEGTDLKEEVIVLTAHYDHLGVEDGKIYNGADDDGSGTVAIMEIAEAFIAAKKAGKGPRRSILIMPVAAEEKGLLGSKFYTDVQPMFPLKNTVVNLNTDMIGRIDKHHKTGDYLYIIGSNMLSTELHDINHAVNETYMQLNLDYRYNEADDPNRFYYRSDHYNFAKHNIPVIFYFNGVHEDYHRPSDTIEKIDFNALKNRTKLIFHTAWQLANQDKRIEVDKQ